MRKKYKMIRVPEEVFKDWELRQKNIQMRLKKTACKPQKVNMTDVLRYYGKRKIDIWDFELVEFFSKKKAKNKFKGGLI